MRTNPYVELVHRRTSYIDIVHWSPPILLFSFIVRPRLRIETGEFRDIIYHIQFPSKIHSNRFIRFQYISFSFRRYRNHGPVGIGYLICQSSCRYYIGYFMKHHMNFMKYYAYKSRSVDTTNDK
ncbi:hypothetical protein AR158_c434R [Paramecium bursaria Chlorella virus AR158]|uniref:hypothetical protein n=1 Tax=Paramecium bursaria Chlorella virus AR158 TaxID=380598 RepID=UPI00015AA6D8|nr:hypothetical protein AR158_c434R [Paramecium bursaria Chlorella virus AR158]ABU43979.1 hypothetical protein AR158_c434R [Paramecium bursaria Chlorella virus AR158]